MFEIYMDGRTVGHAEVKKEGLYYRFFCTCTPPNPDIHTIQVTDGETVRDLGICVPDGENFSLTARVPIKHLKEESLSFTLQNKKKTAAGVPVATGEPFDDLEKLETARLQMTTDGQSIIVTELIPDQPDSDLNQEYPHRSELP